MPVSNENPAKSDASTVRYTHLFRALEPGLLGVVLAAPDLRRRGEWGQAPAAIDAALRATGWLASGSEPPAPQTPPFGPDQGLLLIPLVSDSGRLLGGLALLLPSAAPEALTALRERLSPAVECLRQEISTVDAAARATELQLLRTASQLETDYEEGASLAQVLDASLQRAGAEMVLLLVPALGLKVEHKRAAAFSPSVAAEREGLVARLTAQAATLRRPLVINGPGPRADRAAGCRMLLVPLRCCQGRVRAVVAYLSPIDAAPFGAQQTLVLQAGGSAIVRRLEADLDRRTGLLNRKGLEDIMQRVKRGMGCLLLIDIDRLHAINEVQGFHVGDDLLGQVGDLLKAPLLPQGAHAARLFGGCYAVLVAGIEAQAGADLAVQIQDAVGALKIGKSGGRDAVKVSCGVAEIKNFGEPLAKAFVAAEVVLKLAKERGRSRVEVHVSENSSIIRRHDEVFAAADLREALRTRQVMLFAQKIVSLKDRQAPVGFELLMRMRDPQTGEIKPPKEFIAAAQRYQLLPALDRYVADLAFEMLAPYRDLLGRQRISVSINVSGQSVGAPAFIDNFISQLRASKLPPSVITVEITEQAAVTNLAQASDMMRRLRDAGCGIALDDFGTGANSLAYLRTLPITRIKIDGSFVRDMLTNARSDAAVRGIAQLALGFRLDTVAEMIESKEVADALRAMGIDKGQGYFFGKPEPLEDALAALKKRDKSDISEFLQFT